VSLNGPPVSTIWEIAKAAEMAFGSRSDWWRFLHGRLPVWQVLGASEVTPDLRDARFDRRDLPAEAAWEIWKRSWGMTDETDISNAQRLDTIIEMLKEVAVALDAILNIMAAKVEIK
jgi:hypothetical protein